MTSSAYALLPMKSPVGKGFSSSLSASILSNSSIVKSRIPSGAWDKFYKKVSAGVLYRCLPPGYFSSSKLLVQGSPIVSRAFIRFPRNFSFDFSAFEPRDLDIFFFGLFSSILPVGDSKMSRFSLLSYNAGGIPTITSGTAAS